MQPLVLGRQRAVLAARLVVLAARLVVLEMRLPWVVRMFWSLFLPFLMLRRVQFTRLFSPLAAPVRYQ
jgi:hypothetical protein